MVQDTHQLKFERNRRMEFIDNYDTDEERKTDEG